MSAASQVHPESDTWVASVHASKEAYESLGSGIVLDDRRILTCAHVVGRVDDAGFWTEKPPRTWVAFPKAEEGDSDQRVPVEKVVFPTVGARVKDLAVLYLAEPVPPGVTAAPLRCPRPADLVTKKWWTFGFPDGDPIGDSADGQVGAALGHGWIRLDTGSRYPVLPGFSGGGLWSPDYRAVVAVVGQARGDRGDGRAITLHQADGWFPDEKIRSLAEQWSAPEAGELAMSAWGWSLREDVEGTRHWRPRARGVSIDSERGYRFRGRTAALETIRDWLDREEADRRVLVVTGAPGTGKSAVLGRIVTTADANVVRELPPSDLGVRAAAGSVACAVHAKGKTALEISVEIARAASAPLPEVAEDFAPALREVLSEQGRRFNVIIDALDEMASPAETRAAITKVILPVAETCADVGAQIVVGARRVDDSGDLLGAFGNAARLVDLDTAEFFAEEDLAAYALATLQLVGAERPSNPYADDAVAGPVADRIADLSEGNFLVADLTARAHGLYDDTAVDPATLSFSPRVDDAMREYLSRIPPAAGGIAAETLLAALAFAEAPGLPLGLWRVALRAMGVGDVPEVTLIRFARSSAASFLVESFGGDGHGTAFRLFHQALNDALLRARAAVTDPGADERELTRAFLQAGRDAGWKRASAYLLRSLPAHAVRAGLVDDVLADDEYLLHADLRRVLQAAGQAMSAAALGRVRLLGHTPEAITVGPAERVAMFGVTEMLDGLGAVYRAWPQPVPYRAQWAAAQPGDEILTLRGNQGEVRAVCEVRVGGRTLLATGGSGGAVRLWDPVDGSLVHTLDGRGAVNAMCEVRVGDRVLLATGGHDEAVRLWDPDDGSLLRTLDDGGDWVNAACEVRVGDRALLVTGSGGGVVRVWDPVDGSLVRTLGREDGVIAVCGLQAGDRTLLATGGSGGAVRLWDPVDGALVRTLDGRQGLVRVVCEVRVGDRALLAAGGSGGAVRLWDPVDGSLVHTLDGRGAVNAMCEVRVGDRVLLATGSGSGAVRLWDPVDGALVRTVDDSRGWVRTVCGVQVGHRVLLVVGSGGPWGGGAVRLWDLRTPPSDRAMQGSQSWVRTVCEVPVGDRPLLATGSGRSTVQLWDPVSGSLVRTLDGHQDGAIAVCGVQTGGRILLATGDYDGTVRLWDPVDGSLVRTLDGHQHGVHALCEVRVGGRAMIGVGGYGAVRLWDPVDGSLVRTLDGHQGWVHALCEVQSGGRSLLAAGGYDGAVRLWDPVDGSLVRTLDGHQGWVHALCEVRTGGRTLLAAADGDCGAVRLWDPADGSLVRILDGHQDEAGAVCRVETEDRTLLATGSNDGTVRLWDPDSGKCVLTVPVHYEALALTSVAGLLAVGLAAGVLVIRFEEIILAR